MARDSPAMERNAVRPLTHQAFVYASTAAFTAEMAPFARAGVKEGAVVFAATTAENLSALREELGELVEHVELRDSSEWHPRPYARLQALRELAAELPEGQSLRILDEPVRDGPPAVRHQWARYEAILALLLADAAVRLVCPYDRSTLPQAAPAPSPQVDAVELPLEGSAFRSLLSDHGRRAGLTPDRVNDLVLAADEIVSNAIRYGRAPIAAEAWTTEAELICRVSDRGDGVTDPLAGWLPPQDGAQGGWGLPIARQLCDALEIERPDGGSAVTLHFSLQQPAPQSDDSAEGLQGT